MSERPSRIVPNAFQTPNVLVDEYLRHLTGNELKCYMVVDRQTLGWLKQRDNIALIQIVELTGMSEETARMCMAAMCGFGLIVKTADNDPRKNWGDEYALQMDDKLVDVAALENRTAQSKAKDAARIAKARAARKAVDPVLLDKTALVGQDGGGLVEQDGGGLVQQGTQEESLKIKDSSSTSSVKVFENLKPAEPEPKPPKEPKPEPMQKPNIFRLYEENIGPLTPILADKLKDAEKDYVELWIEYAFSEAVANEKRSWAYIESILKRIKAQGFGGERDRKLSTKAPAGQSNWKATTGSGNKPIPAQPTPEQLAAIERINTKRRQQQTSS